MGNTTGKQVLEGTQELGRIKALFSAIACTVIFLLMFSLGIFIIKHNSNLKFVDAKVIKSNYDCSDIQSGSTIKSCKFDIKYSVNNVEYTKTFTSEKNYKLDQTIGIQYDIDDPAKSEINTSSSSSGFILILIACIILGVGWFTYWLSRRNTIASSALGVSAIGDLIGNRY